VNLGDATSGEQVTLHRLDVPGHRRRRMAEMGLRSGSRVVPLHRIAGGGRVVGVGAARIAVGRDVLDRVTLTGDDAPARPAALDLVVAGAPTAGSGEPGPCPVSPDAPTCRCHGGDASVAAPGDLVVALAGTPNTGKSTLFNALTGASRQMGNWPGTTVSVGRGRWTHADGSVSLIDLPGTHSLDPISPDEELTRRLLVDAPPEQRPDVVAVVVSAADPARGLYLLHQILEQELRCVVVLTMDDIARRHGIQVDPQALEHAVGVPVAVVDPRRRRGLGSIAGAVQRAAAGPAPRLGIADRAPAALPVPEQPDEPGDDDALASLDTLEARFAWISRVLDASTHRHRDHVVSLSDRVDRVLTSPFLGSIAFLAVMWLVFQLTTTWAAPLIDGVDGFVAGPVTAAATAALAAVGLAGTWVEGFVVDGLIAGVGTVLTFVPLMAVMFVLLAILEDSGYLARAAVVADRVMRAVGLPGRAFVPLVVGYGCNVPAVSATRVLPNARHRILTALVVPFATCPARLPVYVLIGAAIFGRAAGNVVFAMYVASVLLVVLGGLLLRSTVLRGVRPEPMVLDLPDYQVPALRLVTAVTWTRLRAFLRTAGGIIVLTVVAVWLLSALPARSGAGTFGDVPIEDSAFAATASAVAPVFEPAGFGDWHTSGALIVGFVAKEAVISSWAQTYAADEPDDLHRPGQLGAAVRADFEESSGGHAKAAGLAFLLFVLGYAPCVATTTAQIQEVGRRWTFIGLACSLAVCWVVAVAVFQLGRVLT
jgi:ferrous iron transport protein B